LDDFRREIETHSVSSALGFRCPSDVAGFPDLPLLLAGETTLEVIKPAGPFRPFPPLGIADPVQSGETGIAQRLLVCE
jgi:hypothetical protein